MRKILAFLLFSLLASPHLQAGRTFRYLHNNDGTDLLSNIWHGRRPISVADVNECVDLIAGTGVITINSWNEWTETSYLQPDNLYGYGYLEAVKRVFAE